METVYSITDIDGFAEHIRKGAAESISENYTENLDDFISIDQIVNFITDISIGLDDDDNLIINENIFSETFDYVARIIYQVGLAKLAANDKIECAWNDDDNEMVFWTKSD